MAIFESGIIFKDVTTAEQSSEAIEAGKILVNIQTGEQFLDISTTERIGLGKLVSQTLTDGSTNAVSGDAVVNNIINTNTTTLSGFMADARQLNPNQSGSLAESVRNLQDVVAWTNPNPTSSFAGQTVTLSVDVSNYSEYSIEYMGSTTIPNSAFRGGFIRKTLGSMGNAFSSNNVTRRMCTAPTGTSISFADASIMTAYGTTVTVLNTECVPLRVILRK